MSNIGYLTKSVFISQSSYILIERTNTLFIEHNLINSSLFVILSCSIFKFVKNGLIFLTFEFNNIENELFTL